MSSVLDDAYRRLLRLENHFRSIKEAPTLPILDPTNPPQDAVECQCFIGTDNSFNWYSSGSWHTQAGTASIIDSVPQDVVDGQIAVGSDNSFHWRVNGTWYTAPFAQTSGNPPQDAVTGQTAIGNSDNFCWFVA